MMLWDAFHREHFHVFHTSTNHKPANWNPFKRRAPDIEAGEHLVLVDGVNPVGLSMPIAARSSETF